MKRYFIADFGESSFVGTMPDLRVIEAVDLEDAKVQFFTWYMNHPTLMTQESLMLRFREEEGLNPPRSNI